MERFTFSLSEFPLALKNFGFLHFLNYLQYEYLGHQMRKGSFISYHAYSLNFVSTQGKRSTHLLHVILSVEKSKIRLNKQVFISVK